MDDNLETIVDLEIDIKLYKKLEKIAKAEKTSVEDLCSQAIKEAVKNEPLPKPKE